MLFCKEFLRFNTTPCRHMPSLVHFRPLQPAKEIQIEHFIHIIAVVAIIVGPRSRTKEGYRASGAAQRRRNRRLVKLNQIDD